jgi:hypothetical protein
LTFNRSASGADVTVAFNRGGEVTCRSPECSY